MGFLDRLEKRFRRFAIPGLIHHVVVANASVYLLYYLAPEWIELIRLDREKVAAGEFWRLITHLSIPPHVNPFFLYFALYLLWIYGRALESAWGAFRFTLFYLVGAVGTTVAGLVAPGAVPGTAMASSANLNLSVFLAFATIYPDFTILMFFVLPVRVKWLGIFAAAGLGLELVFGNWTTRAFVLAATANYILFFWRPFLDVLRYRRRREGFRQKVVAPKAEAFHRCEICGRTERDDPALEFRVCPRCEGTRDYCQEHLQAHEHVAGE
ncbi:MAG: rhomboid family intramembrane serine protease [Planctomycetes bacterium]|nr:rhomboid family intramembrane serine protease [Planctomycetota bacterium]